MLRAATPQAIARSGEAVANAPASKAAAPAILATKRHAHSFLENRSLRRIARVPFALAASAEVQTCEGKNERTHLPIVNHRCFS